MQALLKTVEACAEMINFVFNLQKCVFIVDGKVQVPCNPQLCGELSTEVNGYKYLKCVATAEDFLSSAHCEATRLNVLKIVWALKGIMKGGFDLLLLDPNFELLKCGRCLNIERNPFHTT